MTVDARLADEADSRDGSGVAGIGPIRRSPLADVVHVQIDRVADAANRQHAGNDEVAGAHTSAAGALESDGRMFGRVQEIGAAQMVIALRLSAPQLLSVKGRLDGQR